MQNDSHQFKEQVAKSMRNMCNICQTGAGVSENVTVGEQQQRRRTGVAQQAGSGTSQKVRDSINVFVKISIFPGK